MTNKLKILAFGPQNVIPPIDGGKEGIHGALAALAKMADVTYVYPATQPTAFSSRGYGSIGVSAIPVAFTPKDSVWLIIKATLRGRPFKFEKYGTGRAIALCDSAIASNDFDVILCFHPHTFVLAASIRRLRGWAVPIILREHNIEYQLVESYRDSLSGIRRLAASVIAVITRHQEIRLWRLASAVAFLTDQDLLTARSANAIGNFILVPEGVPIPALRVCARPPREHRLLILLNPRATQSVWNLRQFLRSHWQFASKVDSIRAISLAVTGVSIDELAELVGLSVDQLRSMRVTALGFLPSLHDVFSNALALVSPTFVGGGIRKKILEAMANQLPVIATDLDIQTCHYFVAGENILSLGCPGDFVRHLETLLTDEGLWLRLSEAGRIAVERNANWALFAEVVIAECRKHLKATTAAGRI